MVFFDVSMTCFFVAKNSYTFWPFSYLLTIVPWSHLRVHLPGLSPQKTLWIKHVRIKQIPWQASGGQGRPKSPLQRGWVIAKKELRSSSASFRTQPISVLPVAWFRLIRTRMKTLWESLWVQKSSQLVDAKKPLQPIRPCQFPVFVLTL